MQILGPRRPITDHIFAYLSSLLGGLAESVILAVGSRGINSHGGTLTVDNARIWTGDASRPWARRCVIEDGRISELDGQTQAGRVLDVGGRLVVPGFFDSHCHPQVPFTLTSPEAPMLFWERSVDDVLGTLKRYAEDYSEDRYPRLFGWMTAIFPPGQKPTRQMLDAVVSDRPAYLVHHSGHEFWANTKALQMAGVLERDLPNMPSTAVIHRDADGLATGYLEETEYAGTDGILLRSVREVQPLSESLQVLVLRYILEEFSKVGVTSIWTKDGNLPTTQLYEHLLRYDSLPVRAFLDHLYTPFSRPDDLKRFADKAANVAASGLPSGFLRCDGAKLMLDLPADTHQAWMYEPYADGIDGAGRPVFELDEFREQVRGADALGLVLNLLGIGDRAVHEGLNAVEWVASLHTQRRRRATVEHAEFVQDADLGRFPALDVVPIMNPIGAYPDMEYQEKAAGVLGAQRLFDIYQPWRRLLDSGARVAMGSDFPLAPMDPLVGMHILVTGTDLEGRPEGGWWPHKHLTIEEALRTYTVYGAYAAGVEHRRGQLKEGYDADLVVLSEDILADGYEPKELAYVKAQVTVMNGHALHEDWSEERKQIDFGH